RYGRNEQLLGAHAPSALRHTAGWAHVTVEPLVMHAPSTQMLSGPSAPLGQFTSKHGSGRRQLFLQPLPVGRLNSPSVHGVAHCPLMHRPPPQMSVPSSIWPLQLLSTPSHTSVVGGRPPTHSRLPFTQKILPFWQLPTSEPHGWPTPGTLSSMMPLQSSS